MSDEEKKKYEELKSLLYTGTISQYGKRKLIEIIEKQQKEIEELKNVDLTIVYMNGFYDGEKKVEDKIKAKIEELEKELEDIELKNINKDEINKTTFYFIQKLKHKIEVLQSLLEKE